MRIKQMVCLLGAAMLMTACGKIFSGEQTIEETHIEVTEEIDTKPITSNPKKTASDPEESVTGTEINDTQNTKGEFTISPIEPGDEVFQRIYGCSYQDNDEITIEDLRYLTVLHMGFDGQAHEGELIVHKDVAEDVLDIFQTLYEAGYPIEKMHLIDDYDGNDDRSMEDNNTSAFNYRTIAGSERLSNHSYGKAIDINPLYNPYVYTKSDGTECVAPASATVYANREENFAYKIDENDLCYKLFIEHGFSWGGDWNSKKDYQHFEKK